MTTRDKNLILNFIRQSAVGKPLKETREKILDMTGSVCDELDIINAEAIKSKVIELESLILNYEYLLEHTLMDGGALAQNILDECNLDNLPDNYWGGGIHRRLNFKEVKNLWQV